jgi:hypothetical protein
VSNPDFNNIIKGFFEDWKAAFVYLYRQVSSDKVASDLAQNSIMLIEGAVLMMRIHNNPDYLTSVQQKLVVEFDNLSIAFAAAETKNKL